MIDVLMIKMEIAMAATVLIRIVTVYLMLMLSACGGGGGDGNASPANQAFGGLWDGSWAVDGGGGAELAVAISTDGGKFQMLLPDLLVQASGTVIVDGNRVSGTGFAYTSFLGDTFPDGSTVTALSFEGTLAQRSSLIGSWEIAAGDTGTFNFSYDPEYERNSSVPLLDGNWLPFNFLGDPAGPAFNILNGQVFRQTPACTSNSVISSPDPNFNVYEWAITISTIGTIPCPIEGEYEGLSTLGDSEEPGSLPNDLKVVLATNAENAIALLLFRE